MRNKVCKMLRRVARLGATSVADKTGEQQLKSVPNPRSLSPLDKHFWVMTGTLVNAPTSLKHRLRVLKRTWVRAAPTHRPVLRARLLLNLAANS